MTKFLRSFLMFFFAGTFFFSFAQKKVRFSQINAPHYFMGDAEKQLNSDYSKIVITFNELDNFVEVLTEISVEYSLKKASVFKEYNAVVFDNDNAMSKAAIKRLFKKLQRIPSVNSVTPYYNLDGAQLFFFDLLNFKGKDGISKNQLQNALQKQNLEWLEKYESDYPGGMSIAQVPKGKSIFKVARQLNATGLFEFIYPMSNRIVSEDYIPNDTDFGDLWHLKQTNDADIDAPEAWDLTTGDNNLVIAVQELDGFDLTHPDLAPNIISPYNAFLDVNDAQFLDNIHTHGTRVLGCAGAVGDNNLGVAGVAYGMKVMPIILTDVATNSVNSITLQRAADHIIANGNVVAVTNSWSGSSPDAAEDDQFQRMRTLSRGGLGAVILGSTSNSGLLEFRYPASYKNVVGVGRTTQTDFRYSSSTYNDSVDVSAPGSSILTTDIVGAVGATGDYTTSSGTSFSTPIAAGVVGLMASINPSLSGEELKNILEQSCEKVGNYPYHPVAGRPNGIWHIELGYGRINALTAVLLSEGNTINNNLCADATPLNEITPTQFCFQNASLNGATQSADPLNCTGETSTLGQDAWFEFTAVSTTMEVSVNPLGTGLDAVVAVYSSCNGNVVSCIDAAEGEGFSENMTINGLIVNDTYFVRVYDFSENGEGPTSFNFDVCVYVPGGMCTSPSILSTNFTTATEADLFWNTAFGGVSYEIAIRPTGNTEWTSYLSNSNSILAGELLCNTSFDWRVRALCANGMIGDWSPISNFSTQDCTECLKPYNLTASSVTSNSATLSWESTPPTCVIDGFDGELFEGTATNGTSVVSWGDLGPSTFSATGLMPNTTYTYRVRQDCDCDLLVRSNYVYYTFITPGNTAIDIVPLEPISNLTVNGTNVDVTASLGNNGADNSAGFQIAYYLSASPYFNSYDYLIGTENVNSLAAGASITELLDLDLCGSNIPNGVYYLGFYTDYNQSVTETSEVNNFLFWPDKPITLNCNAPTQYVLSLTPSNLQGGSASGAGTYADGTLASIEAFPNTGWEFVNWTENGLEFSTSSNTQVLMNSNRSLVANFGALTSIQDVDATISFSLSPNPTDGVFTVDLSEELEGASCEMYNLSGKLIASYDLPASSNQLEFKGASGMYFVQLVHPLYEVSKKLIIK